MKTPHKHYEAIIAYAKGADIQMEDTQNGTWVDISYPSWYDYMEYRIKPTPKPNIEKYLQVSSEGDTCVTHSKCWRWDNLKLTFDGETGTLKSAKVI